MKRELLLTLCILLMTLVAHASDKYTIEAHSYFGYFSAEANGIDMLFSYTDNDHAAVQVGGVYVGYVEWGIAWPAVDKRTYGTVIIPSSIEHEGKYYPVVGITNSAFEGVPITKVIIPASVKNIGRDAFFGCKKLTEVEFTSTEEHTVNIGPRAFSGCTSLEKLTGAYNIGSIGSEAFRNCGLVSMEVPRTCKNIAPDAFFKCEQLQCFITQSGGYYRADSQGVLFSGFKLVAYPAGSSNPIYTIPGKTTAIGKYAFNFCKNLLRIDIPASVRQLDEGCIWACNKIGDTEGCLKLEWLDEQELPPTGSSIFGNMPYNILIPKGAESVYKNGIWGTLKQDAYDIIFPFSVDGVPVTSENYKNYDHGVTSGTITYNPREKLLTLDNAQIDATMAEAAGITIRLVGNNTMRLKQGFTIKEETYLDGPGSLTLNSEECGLAIEGYLMMGSNGSTPMVNVSAKTPIEGHGMGGINLDNPAHLTLNPGNGKPVTGLKYFDMDGSVIYSPEGAFFKNGELYTSNGPVLGSVEIVPKNEMESPVSICGVRLTKSNWDNFTHCVTEGKVSYDPTTNTLTLDNATISSENGAFCGITLKEGLNIDLIGNNSISTDKNGINIVGDDSDVLIYGPGRLDIVSQSGYAIYAGQNDVTFTDAYAQLYGRMGCFGGDIIQYNSQGIPYGASVHFVNTEATLVPCEDSTTPVVTNIAHFTLEKGGFTAPAGVHFHKPSATLCDLSGSPLAGKAVSIAKSNGTAEYAQLYVNGIPVTDDNKSYIIDGVTYDSGSNILILHDADIYGWIANFNLESDRFGMKAKSLEVRVLGNNTLTQNSSTPIVTVGRESEMTFSGDGSLSIRNEGQGNGFLLFDGATLRFTDTNIDIESQRAAISATSKSTQARRTRLLIDNTTLHAKAIDTDYAAIEGIEAVRHAWCAYTMPADAYSTTGTSMAGGQKVSDITIAPRTSGLRIGGTLITKDNAKSPEEGKGESLLKTGTYTYDDFTKTLSLFDATIDAADGDGIAINANYDGTSFYGLKIVYSGNCVIRGKRHAISAEDENHDIPIDIISIAYANNEAKDNVTTLTLATAGTTAVNLGTSEANLFLFDADVKVVGDIAGKDEEMFVSMETEECTLLVEDSVSGIWDFSFYDSHYATQGQYFDADKGYVANADGTMAHGVYVLRNDGINPFDNTIERTKDVNFDGVTDVADVANVIDVMASDETGSSEKAASDTNGDGETDVADIATVIDDMAGD